MPYFRFSIQSIQIKNTRSKHEDTDYLAFTLKLGQLNPETQVRSLGNLNSGVFNTGLWFAGYQVSIYDSLTLNYLIVNAGSASSAQAETALQAASSAWANGQGPASTNLIGALNDGQPWFNDELISILNPKSCDGLVAAEQDHFSYGDLAGLLSNGSFRHQTNHPGVRSPSGCGPNSQYTVTWGIDPDAKLI